jgi:tyrosinase
MNNGEAKLKYHFTRRRFIATVGGASVTILGQSFLNVRTALAWSVVRRDVGGMTATDPVILSYRRAIKKMKTLHPDDPLSWAYQAAIHGTLNPQQMTAWNTCAHGSYFFWSWHRMYLYWFERIIRTMSGDPGWTLPYWNWTSPSERQLPGMFRDPTSELFTAQRDPAMNDGSGSLPATDVDYGAAFALLNFTTASSSLEVSPHGAVHVLVGGVGGWMSSVPTAAQDPIFFLHHCNIDRLWDLWLAEGGGRTDPLSDTSWTNTQFMFFNEKGAEVKMTGCDVLRAAQQLGYTYEGEPTQVDQKCFSLIVNPSLIKILIHLLKTPLTLTSEPVSFPIEVESIWERLVALAASKTDTVLLELDNVEAERQPGVVWGVFVGLPSNATPELESPYYVGNMAFFGVGIRNEAHHEFKPARFAFAINRAILASKPSQGHLTVTFIPHGVLIDEKPSHPKPQSTVRIAEASLAVQSNQ